MSNEAGLSPSASKYIEKGWNELRRSSLDPAPDPKVLGGTVSILYIPRIEDIEKIRQKVVERRDENRIDSNAGVEVRYLPENMEFGEDEHGLLYLPHEYIIPGGRFNEMYGWDCYWIIKGLIDDHQFELAENIVNNLAYMIDNYSGMILNANRTYYLTRSQPPLYALMINEVANTKATEERKKFLKNIVPVLEREASFWKNDRIDHRTGLYRYGHPDMGKLGYCPEVVNGEIDEETGFNHYQKIARDLESKPEDDLLRKRFYDPETRELTYDAIASDRGLRESGFDPTMYFGYFGLETLDFNPVCLNSLLYIHFNTLADLLLEIGCEEKSAVWRNDAMTLGNNIRNNMWNHEKGMFFSFNSYTGRQSNYKFLTTVYPLFAGIATQDQAEAVRDNIVKEFETDYGIMTTQEESGCQWDSPFMWAPFIDFTILGLLYYGLEEDAKRIGEKFLGTVDRNFEDQGVMFEKYNAKTGSFHTENISVGYSTNVVGFGWTNATARRIDRMLEQME